MCEVPVQFDANLMHLVTCHVVTKFGCDKFGCAWHSLANGAPAWNWLAKLYSDNTPGNKSSDYSSQAKLLATVSQHSCFAAAKWNASWLHKGSMHGSSLFHLTILQHVCIEQSVHRQTSYQCMGKMVSLLSRIVGSKLLRNLLIYLNPLDHRYSGISTIILN